MAKNKPKVMTSSEATERARNVGMHRGAHDTKKGKTVLSRRGTRGRIMVSGAKRGKKTRKK